jgi:hypothetical protein
MDEQRVGLANPYALAELAVGRNVRWRAIADHESFVEKTLGVSVEGLCAPVPGNLIVSGMADSQKVLFDIHEMKAEKKAAAFTSHAKAGPMEAMISKLSPDTLARVIGGLTGGEKNADSPTAGKKSAAPGYTPPGAEWADPGDFFEEAAEYFDPVQGALGDCYFIAALSAVAWSRPYVIMQRNRAIGPGPSDFVDRIDFYSSGVKTLEVSERVPLVKNTHAWIYARSSEAGEIWPAVYEKAFAKWKTNDSTDEPNYGPIAGGWPVQATKELTNLSGVTNTCSVLTADAIWTAVRSNCLSYRTFSPMTAWTFCQTPSPVDYTGTGIVGYHAYTLLGWAYVNNTKYVVLRNPWGHNGPVINGLAGNWSAYDVSFWRSIPLNAGGVFAIPADTFKKYYWQFGWAS